MGAGPVAGRAAARPPRVNGHACSDPRTHLNLSSKPLGFYQLTPPNLIMDRRSHIHLLSPDEVLHLDPIPWAQAKLRLENPYPDFVQASMFRLKMVSPPSQLFTPEEISNTTANPTKGVRLGLDMSLDPGTFSISLVARDWNLKTF